VGDAELTHASVTSIARLIREKRLSPLEAVDGAIARIERHNPAINAVVIEAFDEARARAKTAEQQLALGRKLGPLHGVPVLMKDCLDFKPGWRNTFGGVRALSDFVSDYYTTFPERIEQAGGIILGKTNAPIFGFRGTCDNYLFGPTRNPFDLTRNSGGSSGGSAAAVAAGLVSMAGGSDGGGSIRIPAAWCGVYGFKPSFGRVPLRIEPNLFGGTHPFLFEGPITRSVADAALVLNVLAGIGPGDPYSFPTNENFVAAATESVKGLRIAYCPNFDVYPVEREVAAVVQDAVAALAGAGAIVEEVMVGIGLAQRELSDLWCRLIVPNSVLGLELLKEKGYDVLTDAPDDLPPEFRHWLERMRLRTAVEHMRDQIIRSQIFTSMERTFERYDLLITPTLACLPVPNACDGNTVGPTQVDGEGVDPLIGWCLTYLINLTGHPAASVPAGIGPSGLPIGMQLVGRRHADAVVLAASAAVETIRPWSSAYDHVERTIVTVQGHGSGKRGRLLSARPQ
jgi:amidase